MDVHAWDMVALVTDVDASCCCRCPWSFACPGDECNCGGVGDGDMFAFD